MFALHSHFVVHILLVLCSLIFYTARGDECFSASDLARFASKFGGNILDRESYSVAYNESVPQFDSSETKFPDYIFECTKEKDVENALKFLITNDCEFRVRSGGHSGAGYSTCGDGCSVLDLGLMNDITVHENDDESLAYVTVQPGARTNELTGALESSDNNYLWWTVLGNDDVGLGGHIHGGGWGVGIKNYGLVADNLISIKIVTYKIVSSGKIVISTKKASSKKNSDIFNYCIKGTFLYFFF